MKRHFMFIFFVLCFFSVLVAQKPPVKYGDIENSDIKMSSYANDTTASAVILCDYGNSYFTYDENSGFQIKFEHHRRIKILNKNGYKWADISIPFYHEGSSNEKITGLKASTFNFENGKIKQDKLSNNSKFIEEINDNWSSLKFTMPNVKDGSVIEYKYIINSDFIFNYRDWQFQYSVPVKWSEYISNIPEYFNYNKTFKGYLPLFVNDIENKNDYISITTKTRSGGDGFNQVSTTFDNHRVEFLSSYNRMVMKEIPAFESEAFLTSSSNYISMIEFELASVKFPNNPIKNYTSSWESVNKELLDSESFGYQISDANFLSGGGFIKEEVEKIKNEYSQPIERMQAGFEYVKSFMKWNGSYGKYVNGSLRKAYKEKSGNSGDINLLLTLMLKKLDLNAEPVVLSTRDNGVIHPVHPSISQFNYVVAMVNLDNKQILLDATDPFNPIDMLPYRCLNDKGRIISPEKTDWIDLYTYKPKITKSLNDFMIMEDGVIKGSYRSSRENYDALSYRQAITASVSQDDFIKNMEKNNHGLKIEKYTIENLDNIKEAVKENFDVTISDQAIAMGDMIYFNPLLYDQILENPFKLEERKYPVDYGYQIVESNIYSYTLPDGYEVEEIPESISYSLPEDAAKYVYNIGCYGNKLQIVSNFNINKTQFLPEEYLALKNFYNQVIAKQAEQIILKRNSE